METIDDETSNAAIDFIKRQAQAGKAPQNLVGTIEHAPVAQEIESVSRNPLGTRVRIH